MTKIKISVDMADFVSELCSEMTQDDLLDLIKQINREVDDYDFSEELRDYFVKEVDEEDSFIDE